MPRPEAILFDLDGVLIDSYEVWFQVMSAAARDLGYPPITREQFASGWGQGMEADQEQFFKRHPISEMEAYYAANFASHLEHLKIAEGVPAVFAALADLGIPSAIVTNTPNPLATDLVVRAGATPQAVVGGNDVPHPKPAPDMVLHACERLATPLATALVVGDSRFDRDAARAAGVRFLGLGIDGDARIERLPDLLAYV